MAYRVFGLNIHSKISSQNLAHRIFLYSTLYKLFIIANHWLSFVNLSGCHTICIMAISQFLKCYLTSCFKNIDLQNQTIGLLRKQSLLRSKTIDNHWLRIRDNWFEEQNHWLSMQNHWFTNRNNWFAKRTQQALHTKHLFHECPFHSTCCQCYQILVSLILWF